MDSRLEKICDRCKGTGKCDEDKSFFKLLAWCNKCKGRKTLPTPEGKALLDFLCRHLDTTEGSIYQRLEK